MPEPGGHSSARLVAALAAVLAAVPLLAYHRYLSADALLYAYDHAQLQYPRYAILCDALQRHGEFPFWQTLVYGGSPFHANPEMPTLYPPVLLLALVASPLLVMNLTILAHLVLAGVGMLLFVTRLARRLGAAPADAAVGGFVAGCAFGLNAYTRLDHFNLVGYGAAHALVPWILLATEALLHGPRPRRAAGALGLLCGAQVATGGLYVFAYTALGLAAWWLGEGLLSGAAVRRRALHWLPAAGAVAGLIVAGRLLPYPDWLATTNRAGGLSEALARGVTLGGHGEFAWDEVLETTLRYTGHGLLLALGVLALPALRWPAARTALALALLGFLLALGGAAHGALAAWVPPFGSIRNALRAWTLVNAFLPVLAGLGVARALGLLAPRRPAAPAAPAARTAPTSSPGPGARLAGRHALALVLALGTLPFWLYSGRHQEILDAPLSYDEVLQRTPHWRAAAERAGEAWRAAMEDVGAMAGYSEQFVSTALGVEVVGGQLGHVWPTRLARHLEGDGPRLDGFARRKRFGVMSVRPLVTAHLGTLPVGNWVPESGEPFPLGIDGTAVEDDPFARPRALRPALVLGVFGDRDDAALYALLDAPGFDPRRHALVAFGPGEAPDEAELAALDALVLVDGAAPLAPALVARLDARARSAPTVRATLPLDEAGRAALSAWMRGLAAAPPAAREPVAGTLARRSPQRTRVEAPGPGWLVVSEPWSLYAGWELSVEGTSPRAPIVRRADGVSSAILVREGERALAARYAPPGGRSGLLLAAAGLVAGLGMIAWPGRRAPTRPSTLPTPPTSPTPPTREAP